MKCFSLLSLPGRGGRNGQLWDLGGRFELWLARCDSRVQAELVLEQAEDLGPLRRWRGSASGSDQPCSHVYLNGLFGLR